MSHDSCVRHADYASMWIVSAIAGGDSPLVQFEVSPQSRFIPKTYSYSRDSAGEAGRCFPDYSGRKRSLAISLRAHQTHRTRVFRRGAVPFVNRESEVLFVGSPSAFRSSTSKMTAGTSIPTSAKIFACFPAA